MRLPALPAQWVDRVHGEAQPVAPTPRRGQPRPIILLGPSVQYDHATSDHFGFAVLPLRVDANHLRETGWHWSRTAKRRKAERETTTQLLRTFWQPQWWAPRGRYLLVVTFTRIAPNALDDDNLRPSVKSVRDALAEVLGLRNDRDPSVRWEYAQRRAGAREYAVEIDVRREVRA